jgi:hypothetical protein
MNPFPIFRPGCHTAAGDVRLCFHDTDLEAAARAYNPRLRPAPLVLGHPADDRPVQGWVDRLVYRAGLLEAQPGGLVAAFVDLVRRGRYRHVSAAFHMPDAPENPTPGRFYLKHVGFLGAMPPAVKGLTPPTFCDCAGCGQAVTEPVVFADISLVDDYATAERALAVQQREQQLLKRREEFVAERARAIFAEEHARGVGISTVEVVRQAERELDF